MCVYASLLGANPVQSRSVNLGTFLLHALTAAIGRFLRPGPRDPSSTTQALTQAHPFVILWRCISLFFRSDLKLTFSCSLKTCMVSLDMVALQAHIVFVVYQTMY